MRSRSERLLALVGAFAIVIAFAAVLELRRRRPPKHVPSIAHVLVVSIDGLSGRAVEALGPTVLPELYALAQRGAFTWNARTDADSTRTIPNHLTMITGRSVAAHGYTENTYEGRNAALVTGESMFDVLARAKVGGILVASKRKFVLFGERWPTSSHVDADDRSDEETVARWEALMRERRPSLSFLHLSAPDAAGHASGWDFTESSRYVAAVRHSLRVLDRAIRLIDADPKLAHRTAIVLTSDHGGEGNEHGATDNPLNFTIPFVVFVPGRRGGELYALNDGVRADPRAARTSTSSPLPPIRNADVANLALELLELPAVPGSTANDAQDMVIGAAMPR